MARGVRRSVDELIDKIDEKIKKKQDEINVLKERRKELESSRTVELAMKIVKVAEEKGISVDDLLESVESK